MEGKSNLGPSHPKLDNENRWDNAKLKADNENRWDNDQVSLRYKELQQQ